MTVVYKFRDIVRALNFRRAYHVPEIDIQVLDEKVTITGPRSLVEAVAQKAYYAGADKVC